MPHFERKRINALYGATANRYFSYYTPEYAEAITMTGQVAIRWASNAINEYMNKVLETEDVDYVTYCDTDSVVGDTIIRVNGKDVTIEEYFDAVGNIYARRDDINQDYVKLVDGDTSLSVNNVTGQLEAKRVKYVMKHKVSKRMFAIKLPCGNMVKVTEDHSIIVEDKECGKLVEVKPSEIVKGRHRIINIVY